MIDLCASKTDTAPLFCSRCAKQLQVGLGEFWQVTIEAVADPTPPRIDLDEPAGVLRDKIEHLIDQLGDLSEREAMDQVHRRLVLHLCNSCYRQWIDNPTP